MTVSQNTYNSFNQEDDNMKRKSLKKSLAMLLTCMFAASTVLSGCGSNTSSGSSDNGSNSDSSTAQAEVSADATTTRFEAEYATITGSVPGLVSVFYGASNNCMLEPVAGASNGYIVSNCYVEGNEDDLPSVTFTITCDEEAEATIVLGVGCGWEFDESFSTIYEETDVNTVYPLTVNGTALTTTATIDPATATYDIDDNSDVVRTGEDIIAANYGTVTLQAGENTITVTGTSISKCIDYLEITTTANVTMEEDHTHTYRVYSEDDFEYIEVEV